MSLLIGLAFIFTSNSVMAQSAITDFSSVRTEAIKVIKTINTTDSGSPVGGESEDIGTPKVDTTPVGIEHEDIGGATRDSSKGNVETTLKIEEGETATQTPKGEIKMMPNTMVSGDEIMVLLMPGPGADEESTITTMSKADLIESLHKSRAVFVKFGDIKGESSDESSAESSLNSQLDSEEATRAKKPKEIVIVGSKVRDVNVPQLVFPSETAGHKFDVFFDVELVSSDDDVELHAVSVAQSDENIKEITLTENSVLLKYKTKIHLLGFLPLIISHRIEVNLEDGDEYGRVKVQLPWWHVFGRKIVKPADLQLSIEESLSTVDWASETISLSFQKIQAQTLQIISNVSKQTHDTAMNSVRNLK